MSFCCESKSYFSLFNVVKEGLGEAFYEIGVHDNGERIGITYEECAESLLVVYHMAMELDAEVELVEVRLGTLGYSLKIRVSKTDL